ncbi:MAG: hypothetical protein OXC95_08935 [Dehalococcoidia bacterium]|nr:hypothetical protein [Dehalococcoidia bacterium]
MTDAGQYPIGHRCCDDCAGELDWNDLEHCCHQLGCECSHELAFAAEDIHGSPCPHGCGIFNPEAKNKRERARRDQTNRPPK